MDKCELDRNCYRYLQITYPIEDKDRAERHQLMNWFLDNDYGELEDQLWRIAYYTQNPFDE
jgi:hypothetical protein